MGAFRVPVVTTAEAQVLDGDFEFDFQFPEWRRDAACLEHPEVEFFPTTGQSSEPARRVCQGCLVRKDCLGWALDEGPKLPGPWGGTTQPERKQLLKDGRLTGDLIRHWGAHAVEGQRIERWDEYDRLKRSVRAEWFVTPTWDV